MAMDESAVASPPVLRPALAGLGCANSSGLAIILALAGAHSSAAL